MSTRLAAVVFGASCVLMAGVAAAATGAEGADLVGPSVRDATSSATNVPATFSPLDPVAVAGGDVDPRVTTTTSLPAAPRPPVPAAAVVVPPPRQLRVESLGIDDPVVTVGLEDDGTLEVPAPTEVGWYRGSAVPGAPTGSAVLTAHVDYDGVPGVFLELGRLEVGAVVVTVDASGVERRYTVTERFQVAKGELPVDELFRRDGAPVLTLITCGGSFEERTRHYRDNIVVRAVPVDAVG